MTSWIKHNIVKPIGQAVEKSSFLFETTDAGFCSQFNNYLYAVLYARSEKTPLYVNDSINAVSIRYPLIQNTFVKMADVNFTDIQITTATNLKKRIPQMRTFLNRVELGDTAKDILTWNPTILKDINNILDDTNIPNTFDVGVNIRSGDMALETKLVPVNTYIEAVRDFQKKSKKDTLDVFLMTDSANSLEEFKKKKDPSWNIFILKYPVDMTGHTQRDFNALPTKQRKDAYLDFVTELFIMQQIPYIVCTFSSNVGRFLHTSDSTVYSLDVAKYIHI